ncbi:hypothetical protein TEA_021102 [Camellia sinensis var. sinensis]|uniref:Cation-transporting P-type ATPase N-terminal domain-containing protein n=1 Tax=Camellia sinensis var. sinensis TaxID=542762 RepID=A0A4S4DBC7_CAMSN|nr:hypothetical protein TEA_021102 [Camellia sinensis var. sinensis]
MWHITFPFSFYVPKQFTFQYYVVYKMLWKYFDRKQLESFWFSVRTLVANLLNVKGLADMLKTNVEKGIHGDDDDLLKRKNAFGSNTYPRKKGRSFLVYDAKFSTYGHFFILADFSGKDMFCFLFLVVEMEKVLPYIISVPVLQNFLWDACRDTTLIILIVAAAASLGLGIKSEGIKEGWYDGGSIALAVLIVIVVTVTVQGLTADTVASFHLLVLSFFFGF